jgi:hypothetical protein
MDSVENIPQGLDWTLRVEKIIYFLPTQQLTARFADVTAIMSCSDGAKVFGRDKLVRFLQKTLFSRRGNFFLHIKQIIQLMKPILTKLFSVLLQIIITVLLKEYGFFLNLFFNVRSINI